MSKIGVLTFHRCINYGSYWQARSLVEGLRARGHDAVLLDHHSCRVNSAEWRCALRPVLPTPVPKSDHPLYRRKIREFFRAFSTLPSSRRFALERPEEMESFDTVVVGSDEVWNLRHPWYGGCPLFYGAGVRAGRIVSYAASFGNYGAWEGLPSIWANRLRDFAAIAVRDENARSLIKTSLGFEPPVVLDPCLQFLPAPCEVDAHRQRKPDRPYVAVYGHNFSAWFGREVRRWAGSRGYKLVSIGYRNDWADEQWITAGPDDFARFMAEAAAVATNFFHGCVFALRHARPFVSELSPYRTNKVRDLMDAVGGAEHLVSADTPAAAYSARLGAPVPDEILQRISSLRQASAAYLDAVLV